ncbi:uncharacterized protein LOC129771738 [Toxorhynchites rutilus septentrionalis]|uniref:uncharacterized protein LOC129771738 n=1 Tax=Toxorhynchites rutilus septentrionalis TaxID=329112 RepID=UPI00247AD412|nr:uncharacterized protein LOC129771738 [Toxorhynchites rutilus septentrionalis]
MASTEYVVAFIITLRLLCCYCTPISNVYGNLSNNTAQYEIYNASLSSHETVEKLVHRGFMEDASSSETSIRTDIKRSAVTESNDRKLESNFLVHSSEENDMELAESHLFRPVFRFKSQYAERRRVRQIQQSTLPANSSS